MAGAAGCARRAVLAVGARHALLRLILTHRERRLPDELLASLTLSSVVIPIALAGGARPRAAIIAGAIWCAVSALATLTVRATIARAKQTVHHRRLAHATMAFSAAALLASFLLTRANVLPVLAATAIVPVVLLAIAFRLVHIHPRHPRAMGWSLVGSNVITLIVILVGLR